MAFASASRTAVSISNSLPGAHFIARAISRTPSTTGFMALGSAGETLFLFWEKQPGLSPLGRCNFSKDTENYLNDILWYFSTKSPSHMERFASPNYLGISTWAV